MIQSMDLCKLVTILLILNWNIDMVVGYAVALSKYCTCAYASRAVKSNTSFATISFHTDNCSKEAETLYEDRVRIVVIQEKAKTYFSFDFNKKESVTLKLYDSKTTMIYYRVNKDVCEYHKKFIFSETNISLPVPPTLPSDMTKSDTAGPIINWLKVTAISIIMLMFIVLTCAFVVVRRRGHCHRNIHTGTFSAVQMSNIEIT